MRRSYKLSVAWWVVYFGTCYVAYSIFHITGWWLGGTVLTLSTMTWLGEAKALAKHHEESHQ